jgi:hypothetical protein
MKGKVTILLTLIMVLLMATPTLAANLEFNGKPYQPKQAPSIESGVTRVTPDVIMNFLGCDVAVEGDSITITENDKTIQMTVGSTAAVVNGETLTMPLAPDVMEGKTYIPLRFVFEAVGASVSWDGDTSTISVAYNETRDGMTAEEVMAKSSAMITQAGRYKMTADMQIDMDMTAKATGEEDQTMKMNMDSDVEAWLQIEPMLMYMKQTSVVNAPESPAPEPQTIRMEMLFNEDGVFMNMPETGWLKMNLEGLNLEELMKQSMTQDPVAAMKQIKEMGIALTFANDQQKDGKEYWVLNGVMGGDIFKSDYFKGIMQQIPSMDQDVDMQKILEGMELDFVYSVWIDKATFYNDYMDLAGNIKFNMDIPATAQSPAAAIDMAMAMQGTYTMSDYGLAFTVPEVKDARDYEDFLAEQMQQLNPAPSTELVPEQEPEQESEQTPEQLPEQEPQD